MVQRLGSSSEVLLAIAESRDSAFALFRNPKLISKLAEYPEQERVCFLQAAAKHEGLSSSYVYERERRSMLQVLLEEQLPGLAERSSQEAEIVLETIAASFDGAQLLVTRHWEHVKGFAVAQRLERLKGVLEQEPRLSHQLREEEYERVFVALFESDFSLVRIRVLQRECWGEEVRGWFDLAAVEVGSELMFDFIAGHDRKEVLSPIPNLAGHLGRVEHIIREVAEGQNNEDQQKSFMFAASHYKSEWGAEFERHSLFESLLSFEQGARAKALEEAVKAVDFRRAEELVSRRTFRTLTGMNANIHEVLRVVRDFYNRDEIVLSVMKYREAATELVSFYLKDIKYYSRRSEILLEAARNHCEVADKILTKHRGVLNKSTTRDRIIFACQMGTKEKMVRLVRDSFRTILISPRREDLLLMAVEHREAALLLLERSRWRSIEGSEAAVRLSGLKRAYDQNRRLAREVTDEEYSDLYQRSFDPDFDVQSLRAAQKASWGKEVRGWFDQAAAVFGENFVFTFLGISNRHDALMFMPEALEKFKGHSDTLKNLMSFVATTENVGYLGDSVYGRFNNAINNYSPDWHHEFEAEGSFDSLGKFFKKIQVKRMEALSPEFLKKLNEMGRTNPRRAAYYRELIAHPTVNLRAVVDMLLFPQRFLNPRIKNDLSPIELTYVGDSDAGIGIRLTPENVVDDLVDGKLDHLQAFPPYKMEREVTLRDPRYSASLAKVRRKRHQLADSPLAYLQKAARIKKSEIRRRAEEALVLSCCNHQVAVGFIRGNSDNFKSRLNDDQKASQLDLLLEQGSLDEILQFLSLNRMPLNLHYFVRLRKVNNVLNPDGERVLHKAGSEDKLNALYVLGLLKQADLAELRTELLTNGPLSDVIRVEGRRLKREEERLRGVGEQKTKLVAEIVPRSDVRAATVGNDTNCCMTFGAENNTDYDFNLGVSIFMVSIETNSEEGNPESRVVAQSVLTENFRSSRGGKELKHFYSRSNPPVICLDNVEGNNRLASMIILNNEEHVDSFIKEFFAAYRNHFAYFRNSQAVVGQCYNDYLQSLPEVPNDSSPKSVTLYTDNSEANSNELLSQREGAPPPLNKAVGVHSINYKDSWPVSFIEKKSYPKSFHNGLSELRNVLMASQMVSVRENIPELTLGYFDEAGVLRGYLLAYLAEDRGGNDVLYIHDTAVMPKLQGKGIYKQLKQDFFRRVKASPRLRDLEIVLIVRKRTYELNKKNAAKWGYQIVSEDPIKEKGEKRRVIRMRMASPA